MELAMYANEGHLRSNLSAQATFETTGFSCRSGASRDRASRPFDCAQENLAPLLQNTPQFVISFTCKRPIHLG